MALRGEWMKPNTTWRPTQTTRSQRAQLKPRKRNRPQAEIRMGPRYRSEYWRGCCNLNSSIAWISAAFRGGKKLNEPQQDQQPTEESNGSWSSVHRVRYRLPKRRRSFCLCFSDVEVPWLSLPKAVSEARTADIATARRSALLCHRTPHLECLLTWVRAVSAVVFAAVAAAGVVGGGEDEIAGFRIRVRIGGFGCWARTQGQSAFGAVARSLGDLGRRWKFPDGAPTFRDAFHLAPIATAATGAKGLAGGRGLHLRWRFHPPPRGGGGTRGSA